MLGPQFEMETSRPPGEKCKECYRFWQAGGLRTDPYCAMCADSPDLRSYFTQISEAEKENFATQTFIPQK